MRLIRWLAAGVWVVAALLLVAFILKDPEKRVMDPAARAAAPGQFVPLVDGTTHYEVTGPVDGPVVLLTSGFSVPAWFSDSLFQQLGDSGFRVVRFDFYGRGWSDRPDIAYDLDLFSRQMHGLLDSLGVTTPVAVAGLSYGSAMASHFVAQHPGRVAALLYVDPVFNNRRPLPARERTRFAWDIDMVLRGGTDRMAAGQPGDFLDPARFPGWAGRYREQQQFKGTREAWRRTRASIATWPDQRAELEELGRMGKPVLVVWGREDQVAPLGEAAALLAAMPGATLLAVDSAGHLPHMEQAGTVIPAVARFLEASLRRQPLRATPGT